MDKITEALKKLLPQEQVGEIADVLKSMVEEAKTQIEAEKEKEYSEKLEAAYADITKDLAASEKTAVEGYEQALVIITGQQNQIALQTEEFKALEAEYKKKLNEGYQEAYELLEQEKEKSAKLEVELYEEYDKKVNQLKEGMIEKIDQFLQFKESEIAETVKRELLTDPRTAEHKVTLDKVVEAVSRYMTEDGLVSVASGKIEESNKKLEEIKGQLRILEARNIKLSNDNGKLNESLRQVTSQLNENTQKVEKTEKTKVIKEQNERAEKAKNVTGRGSITADDGVVIAENNSTPGQYSELQVLAGVHKK